MSFQIPLHISRELRPEDRLDGQKRACAQLAFLMNQLSPKGFRTPRRGDPLDLSFSERRLMAACMIRQPEPRRMTTQQLAADQDYRSKVRQSRGLTNYEQSRWYRQPLPRRLDRSAFVGCRSGPS